MSDEKQVAVKEEAGLPSSVLFEDDAASGFENVKTSSLALPILKLLQNGSGEAQKRNQNYVEGADPGMLLNTVTKKLYNGAEGVTVIPCHYKLEYQEWADFGTGSGRPENIFADGSDILAQTTQDGGGKDRLENGHYILTVGQHYVLIVGDDGAEQALISMSSSQGKISRKWNSMMMGPFQTRRKEWSLFTPPTLSHAYKRSKVLNSGKGDQWYGYNIVKEGPVTDAQMYERAKTFYTSLAGK